MEDLPKSLAQHVFIRHPPNGRRFKSQSATASGARQARTANRTAAGPSADGDAEGGQHRLSFRRSRTAGVACSRALANERSLREPDDWSRREADVRGLRFANCPNSPQIL